MARDRQQNSYRFVIVYRREPREIPGAAGEWRGWIARVLDPRERELEQREEARRGFLELEELPQVMRELMNEPVEAHHASATGNKGDR